MSFLQQPIHTRISLDPAPEPEPVLVEVARNLFVPFDWSDERKQAWADWIISFRNRSITDKPAFFILGSLA